MQFHERLRKYRKQMGLSQEVLAEKLYVSRSAVAKWENGLGLPSEDSLDAIAEFFGVNREELLSDRETETIIVEKNGKLSRQKTYLIGLIVLACALLIVSAIILGVFLTRGNDSNIGDGNNNGVNNTDNGVNNTDEEITAPGIVKEDIYTWFDMNKTNLPGLEKCKKIQVGMSLNQVISEIGKPQRDIGSGVPLFQFDLDDGTILTVSFDIENKLNTSNYDSLIVSRISYDLGVPEIFFPYCGSLSEFYPWINELKVENIIQVRYEHAFIGVAPGSFKDISYTTNSVDIENSYRLLFSNVQEISINEGQVTGGGYVKYDFLTANNKTYSVKVSNNRLFINYRYYKFVNNFYYEFQNADTNCYAFDTNVIPRAEQYEIYTYANESVKVGDYDGIGEFEFCIYDGLIEKTPSYYAKTALDVNLLILSENQFMIENDYKPIVYQIISKKDFSALFEKSTE